MFSDFERRYDTKDDARKPIPSATQMVPRMAKTGSSYYGPTAVGGPKTDDLAEAEALGRRVARYARWIERGRDGEEDEIEGGLFYREKRGHLVLR